ncbi:hypothetical protein BC828DRAFT_430052 [Blastocladiella britannica]|nr:hypothetical protein BC828DRAFT_430052 [Blastocladiella britannica]
MSNKLYTWASASISSCCVLIDGYMLVQSIREWRSHAKRAHQQGHPPWVLALQSLAWATFLVANVFQAAFMVGFATIDTCGGETVVAEPTRLVPKWWAKDCIISTLEICYQILGFLPLPVFPILHMRLVVQLHQYSNRTRTILAACAGGTVLAMFAQVTFTVLIVLSERVSGMRSLQSTFNTLYKYAYDVHMLFVLAMGTSSMLFILQFLRTITARVVAPATAPADETATSRSSTPLKPQVSAVSRLLHGSHPQNQQRAAVDRVTQFNAAVGRVRHMTYVSVCMLEILVLAIIVWIMGAAPQLLSQSLISLLGQCLLASFCLTTGRMRPLMIMRRQLPTVDAGTLATDWSAAASNASHVPMVHERNARLTIVEP